MVYMFDMGTWWWFWGFERARENEGIFRGYPGDWKANGEVVYYCFACVRAFAMNLHGRRCSINMGCAMSVRPHYDGRWCARANNYHGEQVAVEHSAVLESCAPLQGRERVRYCSDSRLLIAEGVAFRGR